MAIYTVSIEVEIHDEMELLSKALLHAIDKDGCTPAEAAFALIESGEVNVGACLITLLDPGCAPHGAGFEVLSSTAECEQVPGGAS